MTNSSGPISREEATAVVRSIFRRCGYCVAEHGTRGRDLDLVAVPWTDRAGMPSIIVAEVIEALEGEMLGDPERKPHGRVAYAIRPGGTRRHDMWFVDLSVLVPAEYDDEIVPRLVSADEYIAEVFAGMAEARESVVKVFTDGTEIGGAVEPVKEKP